MLTLDHLAVSAMTLTDRGSVEVLLGVPLQTGGQHAEMATHNLLLSLGPEYLEVIAPDPNAAQVNRPRWFDLDHFFGAPRLTNWVGQTDDLEAFAEQFPHAGEVMHFARGNLRWKMLVPRDGKLPFDGAFPALIEWVKGHPAPHLIPQNCYLSALEVRHPFADDLRNLLAPVLSDTRIRFASAPVKSLKAEIATPYGVRVLT